MPVKTEHPPDFVNGSPWLEPVVGLAKKDNVVNAIQRRGGSNMPRFPQLPNSNGELRFICFNSALASPRNTCCTSQCKNRKKNVPSNRPHIDLSKEPWCSKPEAYWKPLVDWFQHDMVKVVVRPTKAFKDMTPSASW